MSDESVLAEELKEAAWRLYDAALLTEGNYQIDLFESARRAAQALVDQGHLADGQELLKTIADF